MTLIDLERRDESGQNFLTYFYNHAKTVRPRATKWYWYDKWYRNLEWHVVPNSVFLGAGSPCPKGAGRQRPKNFGTPTYAQTVWHRATKFGVVTHVGMGVFFSQGGGALASQTFWGFPTCAHLLWETTTKFCAVIKLHVTKNFARSATNADGRSVSGIANLLDDLSTLSIFTLSLYLFISCLPFASNSTPQSDNTSQRSSKI